MRFRLIETAKGLRVVDDKTGKRLGTIAGAKLSHIEEMEETQELDRTRIMLVEADSISYVDPPWTMNSDTTLFAADDQVFAFVNRYSQQGAVSIDVWRSDDGRSWVNLGPPSLPGNVPPLARLELQVLDEVVAISAHVSADNGPTVNVGGWDSTDGVTWHPRPADRPEGTQAFRTASGWFAAGRARRGYSRVFVEPVWMHVGDQWVSLAGLGFDCSLDPDEANRVDIDANGSTTLVWATPGCDSDRDPDRSQDQAPDLWVLSGPDPG